MSIVPSYEGSASVSFILELIRAVLRSSLLAKLPLSVLFTQYKLAAPKYFFFWPAFVTRLLTPRSRKSGYGLLLGCRSGLDFGPFEKTFFDKVRTQKPGKFSLPVLVQSRNRSGVVELVGREPWIIARVENGVTKFSPNRQ